MPFKDLDWSMKDRDRLAQWVDMTMITVDEFRKSLCHIKRQNDGWHLAGKKGDVFKL